MTFTVSCPSCGMSFPVDPAKVPEGGVRAQCSMCPEIFDVDRPDEATLEAAPEAAPSPELAVGVADPLDPGSVDLPAIDGSFEEPGSAIADEPSAVDTAPFEEIDAADVPFETADAPFETADAPFETADAPFETADGLLGTEEPLAAEPTAEFVAVEPPAEPEVAEPPTPPSEPPAESAGPVRFGRRSPEDKAKSLARSLVSDLVAYNPEKHKEALAAGTLQEVFGEEIEKSLKEYQEQVDPDVMAQGSIFNDALNSILAEGQPVFSLEQ